MYSLLSYQETPVQEVLDNRLLQANIRLLIKREDLNHPLVSGNKWWKLKNNLSAAKDAALPILTFGGAYSNHIFATAAAARELKYRAIGIIRGEETLPLNPTLQATAEMGMELHYISREQYRNKTELAFLEHLKGQYGDVFIIPEGGSNALAVEGMAEFTDKLTFSYDYLCCPVGTGGTMAGLVRGLRGNKQLLGFSVLKNGAFLTDEVKMFDGSFSNWSINLNYHFGGYAKTTNALQSFIDTFSAANNVPLEFIYTGKMFYGILELVASGYFDRGSTICAIHTGGIRPRVNS